MLQLVCALRTAVSCTAGNNEECPASSSCYLVLVSCSAAELICKSCHASDGHALDSNLLKWQHLHWTQ